MPLWQASHRERLGYWDHIIGAPTWIGVTFAYPYPPTSPWLRGSDCKIGFPTVYMGVGMEVKLSNLVGLDGLGKVPLLSAPRRLQEHP